LTGTRCTLTTLSLYCFPLFSCQGSFSLSRFRFSCFSIAQPWRFVKWLFSPLLRSFSDSRFAVTCPLGNEGYYAITLCLLSIDFKANFYNFIKLLFWYFNIELTGICLARKDTCIVRGQGTTTIELRQELLLLLHGCPLPTRAG